MALSIELSALGIGCWTGEGKAIGNWLLVRSVVFGSPLATFFDRHGEGRVHCSFVVKCTHERSCKLGPAFSEQRGGNAWQRHGRSSLSTAVN